MNKKVNKKRKANLERINDLQSIRTMNYYAHAGNTGLSTCTNIFDEREARERKLITVFLRKKT